MVAKLMKGGEEIQEFKHYAFVFIWASPTINMASLSSISCKMLKVKYRMFSLSTLCFCSCVFEFAICVIVCEQEVDF